MKVSIILLFFLPFALFGNTQPFGEIESYNSAKTKSDKFDVVQNWYSEIRIAQDSKETKADLLEAMNYFKSIGDENGSKYVELALVKEICGSGDYVNSLNRAFKLLKYFQENGDDPALLNTYTSVGLILDQSKNYAESLIYARKTVKLAEALGDEAQVSNGVNSIANAFLYLNQLDSAMYYAQKALNLSNKNVWSHSASLNTLGEVYMEQGDHDIGRPLVHKSIILFKTVNNMHGVIWGNNDLAESFYTTGDFDSSLIYSRIAYDVSKEHMHKDQEMRTLSLLANTYDKLGVQDSALHYLRLVIQVKDEVLSAEKTSQIQSMAFEEKLRQNDAKLEKEKNEIERNHTIQYAAIGIGIILLLTLLLLSTRSIVVKEKWIRFAGVLGLLISFEFINLIMHPYLGELTHHSPILMLSGMVLLAALIIPLHHKIEHWTVHKLTEKNKKIRLAKAKQTIAEIEEVE